MSVPNKDEAEVAEGLLDQSYCSKPEHFFSIAARDLVGRYLGGWLDQLVITPTELAHSAKYQKRLNDAGRVLMNLVDKIGTLQARHKSESPTKRVRELHDLVSQTCRKVWDDERDKPIASVKAETFAEVVARLPATDRDYAANRILTEYLSQFKVWKDKAAVLVRLFALCEKRDFAPMVEYVLAEVLKSEPALDQLFGMPERLEARCNDLVDLWKGTWETRETTDPVVVDINALVAKSDVPFIKAAIEYSLLRTLANKMPLRSAEPENEIQAVSDMARRMWTGQALIGGTKALALLEKRHARHINTEGITDLLRERKVVADRLLYLMNLSAVAIGQGNRVTLKAFIDHYFGDRDFVPRVSSGQEPPVPKLQTLAQLHRTIKGSWLSDEEKTNHAGLIEAVQLDLLKRSRLFEQIDKKGGGPAQKVLTLLDLCRKGTFIDGPVLDNVRGQIQIYLRDSTFTTDYLAGASGDERDRKITLLAKTLAAINITWAP